MSPFDVWAPKAGRVRLAIGDANHEMRSADGGWWTADVASGDAGIEPDALYAYLLDDDPQPLPDPRSRRQPHGVHGRSQRFDAAAYRWNDAAWTGRQLAGGVIYEMHVGTFTSAGTLISAIDKLDHLVELGVSFVEVMPVNAFSGTRDWGYAGVLWYAVDESYGGPAAYQRFVDACHERGLAVIQDVVYNHLGPSGNYLPRFGPYTHEESANAWGASMNLDEPAVRRFILDNAAMWMRDYHVDALRLDAVHALVDTSPTHILQSMAEETDALSAFVERPLTLIAESDLNDPQLITPREAGGYGLAAQWSDDFHHALHVALTGEITGYYADFERLDAFAKVLTKGFFHDGTYSSFRGRNHGVPIDTDTMPAWRLVVASQTHDQVGNRAAGDRLTATLDHGQLAIAAVLNLAGPFTPMLFMGEEWGASTPWQFFTDHTEPELARATAEGRIKEFAQMGWDPSTVPDPNATSTFANSKLVWSELDQPGHRELLELYRELGRLRRELPDLVDPRFSKLSVRFDADARWLVILRGSTAIAVNFAEAVATIPVSGRPLLRTHPDIECRVGHVVAPPHSAVILAV